MNNKTFGVVVGVIIALALVMFSGLYMLGLSGNNTNTFNDGYEYNYDDIPYDSSEYDEAYTEYYNDFIDYEYTEGEDFFYDDSDFYFDEDGNAYYFDDYEFEDFDYDTSTIE